MTGRAELEGKEGQDAAPTSHVSYRTEDDETKSGPTVMQKLKERISDYGNHLKGKESSEKEDPHPELAYIPPGDGKGEATANAQEGKKHGGLPTASLGKDVPTDVTKDYEKNKSGGLKKHFSGEGADEPTTMEKLKAKFTETENHLKGKESSAVEDPHPELAYITPMPQEEKSSFFSKMEQKFGGQKKASAVPKGTGNSELGTGYEEDSEETVNPDAVPKYDDGVKPQP